MKSSALLTELKKEFLDMISSLFSVYIINDYAVNQCFFAVIFNFTMMAGHII